MTRPPNQTFRPLCAYCGTPTATIQLTDQDGRSHLIYTTPGGSNDTGQVFGDAGTG